MSHLSAPPPPPPRPRPPSGDSGVPADPDSWPDAAPPPYPGEELPVYPGEDSPVYRSEDVSNDPGEEAPVHPDEEAPAYPGEEPVYPASQEPVHPAQEPVHPMQAPAHPIETSADFDGAATPWYQQGPPLQPAVPPMQGPPFGAVPQQPLVPPRSALDDMHFQQGRVLLKAHQRGADQAAVGQLMAAAPMGVVSFVLIVGICSMFSPGFALVVGIAWLLSGLMVFHRPAEDAIARYALRMRRPTGDETARLEPVWAEVTRRAGVRGGHYELWIQERDELNANAAAGHIVGVTTQAVQQLPNSQLAAVLSHELGHHVSGHTWTRMLAHWYALPARTVWGLTWAGLSRLFRGGNLACGGCLALVLGSIALTLLARAWWFVIPLAAAPLLLAMLSRRAELSADAYAASLGFAPQLIEVLAQREATASAPGIVTPAPWGPSPAESWVPPQHQAQPAAQHRGLSALFDMHPDHHTRLHRLRLLIR